MDPERLAFYNTPAVLSLVLRIQAGMRGLLQRARCSGHGAHAEEERSLPTELRRGALMGERSPRGSPRRLGHMSTSRHLSTGHVFRQVRPGWSADVGPCVADGHGHGTLWRPDASFREVRNRSSERPNRVHGMWCTADLVLLNLQPTLDPRDAVPTLAIGRRPVIVDTRQSDIRRGSRGTVATPRSARVEKRAASSR